MPNPLEPEFWEEEEELLWAVLVDLLMGSYEDGVIGGVDILPPNIAPLVQPDLVNSAAVEFAKQFRFDQISGITDTSRKQVQRAMSDWIESGESLDVLESKLSPVFGDFRAKMIAQTETTRIFAEANQAAWTSTGFVSHKQWMTSRDDRVCIICEPLDGQIVAAGNAFFSGIGGGFAEPPAHVNCLTGDSLILPIGDISAGTERWYEGDVVTIDTLENKLTVTPNHPILTRRGWVAASNLKHGDNIVCYDAAEWEAFLVEVNEKNGEARVKDIFSSLSLEGFRMPVAPPDFHNDGAGSDVAIVRPNSFIVGDLKPQFVQPFAESDLISGNIEGEIALSGLCPHGRLLNTNNASPSSIVGGSNLGGSLALAHPAPLGELSFGLTTDMDARIEKALSESPTVNARFFSELIFGLPGLVTLQKVVKVGNNNFSGHVYNLQTNSGLYIADGIITHNCRCWLQPVVDVEGAVQQIGASIGV